MVLKNQMEIGEFIGYTKNEFSNLKESLLRIEKNSEMACTISRKNQNDITEMKAQAAVIGAGASLLVSVGLTILIKLFGF
jgi:hypothetical protein